MISVGTEEFVWFCRI